MLTQFDEQYRELVLDVAKYGYTDEGMDVRPRWKDGTPAYTKSLIGRKFFFDNKEIPILTTKKLAWKTAIKEILWIWQMKSNKLKDLRDMGVKIWDEWELKDGTIGRAYGHQLGMLYRKKKINVQLADQIVEAEQHVDQVDYLLSELKSNPASRRHITEIWIPQDLDAMALTPCVHLTQWHVKEGKLHLEVRARSSDLGLGNPFNVFQYNVLQRMIAQVTGYELGEYHFYMGDAHIYDRHIEPLTEQVERETHEAPTLWINPDVKDFYDFTIDDFKLEGYKHGDKVELEVAI